MTIEFVVCRCNEQPDWLERVSERYPVTVYDKGSEPLARPGQAEILHLKNVGRESQAWCHHMLTGGEGNDPFPLDWTVYVQAEVDYMHIDNVVATAERLAAQELQTWSAVSSRPIFCDQDGRPDHAQPIPIRAVWEKLFTAPCPSVIRGFAGGQFIVRNEVLQKRPRRFWRTAYDLLSREVDPPEGYVMERLWRYILDGQQ